MSSVWLPCGDYHQDYAEDQGWWQTRFLKGKMMLLLAVVFLVIPWYFTEYWVSVWTMIGYTAMGALGVQLLIGYTGLITLGHARLHRGRGLYEHPAGTAVSLAPVAAGLGSCLPHQHRPRRVCWPVCGASSSACPRPR